jgi:hypothetical protein
MAARQATVILAAVRRRHRQLWPISYEGQSDTACFDNALELLVHGRLLAGPCGDDADPGSLGRQPLMDEERKAFYEYHAALMEPWDGPAAVAFTDGRQIGATLDRNGLRPARYLVTDDDRDHGVRSRRAADIPEEKHRQEVAPAARQDAADRPGRGPHHRPTRRSRRELAAKPSLSRMAGTAPRSSWKDLPGRRPQGR